MKILVLARKEFSSDMDNYLPSIIKMIITWDLVRFLSKKS